LEKIEETGATWLRPNFGYFVWGVMQKEENAPIDFSETDKVVMQAQKRGLNLLITIFPFADWDQKVYGNKCKVSDNDEMLPRSKGILKRRDYLIIDAIPITGTLMKNGLLL
jgi:hypothetical protein